MKKAGLIILSLLAISTDANSQNNLFTEDAAATFLGTSYGATRFCDIDNDGDQDLFIFGKAEFVGPSALLMNNDGAGNFTQNSSSITGLEDGTAEFADIDGDGDQDLVYTGNDVYPGFGVVNQTMIYKNDGTGIFTQVTVVSGTFVTSGLVGVHAGGIDFGDIDSDGDQDLIISGSVGSSDTTILYGNDGTGTFTQITSTPFNNAHFSDIKFVDIDGDNDQDVFITGINGASGYRLFDFYENDGAGNYTQLPGTISAVAIDNASVDFSDIDNDGDLDLLATGQVSVGQQESALYTNDGTGTFTLVSGTPFENVHSGTTLFNDIDNDGDEDVLITGDNGTNFISKVYTNNGSGVFTEAPSIILTASSNGSADFADIDGDGDNDLIVMGFESPNVSKVKIYRNGLDLVQSLSDNSYVSEISISPNPVQNELFIQIEEGQAIEMVILDYSGRVVKSITNSIVGSIDVSELKQGVYLLKVSTDNGVSTNRFIKQ